MKVHVAWAAEGEGYGKQTQDALYRMRVMVAFCFENYGEKTYSSCSRLKYANANHDHNHNIIEEF